MSTPHELFCRAYTETHQAADLLSRAYNAGSMKHTEVVTLLEHLRAAQCAAQELRNRLEGNPPAKLGD
jgi:hypothetical protein